MSVTFTHDSSDYLLATAGSALTIGTGDFSFGCWVKITQTAASSANQMFFLADARPPSGDSLVFGARCGTVTTAIAGMSDASPALTTTEYTYTTNTWYYMVVSRAGTTFRYRVFDDSSSTTPLSNQTATNSNNYTTIDTIIAGYRGTSDGCVGMEMESFKVYTGAEWTNAECRTESTRYLMQKSGGTNMLAWRLKDTDADTDGLNEQGGAGPNFTNSGVTNGSTSPTNLSEAGGGSIGFDDGDGPVFLTRLRPATTVRLV